MGRRVLLTRQDWDDDNIDWEEIYVPLIALIAL